MAAASRAIEARVPCPVCNGPIHPVAGKCKHCKSDLRAMRGTRPAAPAPLPPLAPSRPVPVPIAETRSAPSPSPGSSLINGSANGHVATNGHSHGRTGYTPSPSQEPQLPAINYEQTGPVPVLPARVTARHATGTVHIRRSALRHWPVVVIVLAVIAILAAIALLVWPPPGDGATKRTSPAVSGPAPERMDTNPLPDQPAAKPTPKPAPPPQADPLADPAADPAANDPWNTPKQNRTQTLPHQPRQDDLDDPFSAAPNLAGQLDQLQQILRSGGMSSAVVTLTGIKHACAVASRCGNDVPMCQAVAALPDQQMPACPAAAACLRRIDRLSCAQDNPDELLDTVMRVPECQTAMGC
jgi:hypothetical protein